MTPRTARPGTSPLSRATVLTHHWTWRHDIQAQVINTDIDGLMTACLLHDLKGWPVVGVYDTRRLWLAEGTAVPLDLSKHIWVDIDMCWPGARSLSQHVVLERPSDIDEVTALKSTINPSLMRGHSRLGNYRDKYPFGTFQWAWWLAKGSSDRPQPSDQLRTGLAWMADGGFGSIVKPAWKDNCIRWATETLPGSLLEPLVRHDEGRSARISVREACGFLQRKSGVDDPRLWRNFQLNLTRSTDQGPAPIVDPGSFTDTLQAVADVICDAFGWRRMRLPVLGEPFEGAWHKTRQAPDGWPAATDALDIVSAAATSRSKFCWTSPRPPRRSVRRPLSAALGDQKADFLHRKHLEVDFPTGARRGSPRPTGRTSA